MEISSSPTSFPICRSAQLNDNHFSYLVVFPYSYDPGSTRFHFVFKMYYCFCSDKCFDSDGEILCCVIVFASSSLKHCK